MSSAPLNDKHRDYLQARAALDMALKVGARSVDAVQAGERLNLGYPLDCGGILLDYPDADGVIEPLNGPCRLRLDNPKKAKFLPQKGSGAPPYLPPASVLDQSVYDDTTVTIVFAEGSFKSLALNGIGLAAIGLGGVSTGHDKAVWKDGRGKLVLHSYLLKRVKWKGRKAVIIFDANRAYNPGVAYGEAMLAEALRAAGAIVLVAELPLCDNGADRGPDDFLASEGAEAVKKLIDAAIDPAPLKRAEKVARLTKGPERAAGVTRLLADFPFRASLYLATKKLADVGLLAGVAEVLKPCGIAKGEIKEVVKAFDETFREHQERDDSTASSKYTVKDGRTCVETDDGPVVIAHFTATITKDVLKDDGAEKVRLFHLEGALPDGKALPVAKIRAEEFESMEWPTRVWGAKAVIESGRAKDQARTAIQLASNAEGLMLYAHTGWRDVNGERVYLFNGGAVGGDAIGVELEGTLANYTLPSAAENIKEAIKLSLSLLDVAPAVVAVPLLSVIYAAVLAYLLKPDFTLWLRGLTGHFKSELAALVMAHFGSFTRKVLPASWIDTETSIEGVLFRAKDTVVVIDDYKPPKDFRGQRELEKKAGNILQSVGNRASRARSRADLTLRPERPPRCQVISTGESIPDTGASTLARLVVVEMDKHKIDIAQLTKLQEQVHRLPHAMRGYIEWLRPQLNSLEQSLPQDRRSARDYFTSSTASQHQREPENLAHLYLGFDLLVRFALSAGAIDLAEGERLRDVAHRALTDLAEAQGADQRELDPGAQYLAIVKGVLEQGKVCLLDDGEPLDPDARRGTSAGERDAIGWKVGTDVYLLVAATFQQVYRYERDGGRHWPHRQAEVNAALERVMHTGRTPAKKYHRYRAGGQQHEVLRIDGKRLFGDDYLGVPEKKPVKWAGKTPFGSQ